MHTEYLMHASSTNPKLTYTSRPLITHSKRSHCWSFTFSLALWETTSKLHTHTSATHYTLHPTDCSRFLCHTCMLLQSQEINELSTNGKNNWLTWSERGWGRVCKIIYLFTTSLYHTTSTHTHTHTNVHSWTENMITEIENCFTKWKTILMSL